MGVHMYSNAEAGECRTTKDPAGPIRAVTDVYLYDESNTDDRLQLSYTSLDTLDETIRLFLEARSQHLAAIMDSRSERVRADELEVDDLAILTNEGDLVLVVKPVLLESSHVTINFCRKYKGAFDGSDSSVMQLRMHRTQKVTRLMADVPLAVVR